MRSIDIYRIILIWNDTQRKLVQSNNLYKHNKYEYFNLDIHNKYCGNMCGTTHLTPFIQRIIQHICITLT